MHKTLQFILLPLLFLIVDAPAQATESIKLPLSKVVDLALLADPWIKGSEFRESSLRAEAISAGELPDPVVSVNMLNLPGDGFSLSQEPMTQMKMGLSQMLPRGDSLALRKDKMTALAEKQPAMRKDRFARLRVETASIWLELYLAQHSIALIEEDRNLFEQLGDVAGANYASALGRARQQDVIRARLELTRLDDRVTALSAARDVASARLTEWLGNRFLADTLNIPAGTQVLAGGELPQLSLPEESKRKLLTAAQTQRLIDVLNIHPSVLAIDQSIQAAEFDTRLARQLYKPQWTLNAAYSWRDDDPQGQNRSDLFSLGVSFDLPLFTERRQDQKVSSAVARKEAVKTEKRLQLRQLLSGAQQAWANIQRLTERQTVYQDSILPQIHEQAEASLTAYTNDDGDFAEVVRARIDDLNARIDALSIDVQLAKALIRLNYYFTGADQASSPAGAN